MSLPSIRLQGLSAPTVELPSTEASLPVDRSDMHSLLAELGQAGMVDSRGSFSLDSRKALEKASALRFRHPQQYLRCLYRAAVLGDARRLDVYADIDDTILSFDGPALSDSQMRYLLASAFVNDNSYCARRLQQFALGLQGAWQQGFSWAEVRSTQGAYRFTPDQPEPTPVPARPLSTSNQLHLKLPLSKSMLSRALQGPHHSLDTLHDGLGYCHMSTYLNGELLPGLRCPQGDFSMTFGLPESLLPHGSGRTKKLRPLYLENTEYALLFDLEHRGGPGRLKLLVADVLAGEYELPDCPGFSGTLSVGPFPLDASQSEAVQGPEFQLLMLIVHLAWAEALLSRVYHEPDSRYSAERQFKMALEFLQQPPLCELASAQELHRRFWDHPLIALDEGGHCSLRQAAGRPARDFRHSAIPLLRAAGLQA